MQQARPVVHISAYSTAAVTADPVSARPKKETTKNKRGCACDLTYLKDTYPNHCKYLVQYTRDDLVDAAVPLVL